MIKSFFNANNVSEINAIYMTKEFQNVIAGNREIVIYIPRANEFLLINFTRGENLLPEDIESGMNDSAYIRVLSVDAGLNYVIMGICDVPAV